MALLKRHLKRFEDDRKILHLLLKDPEFLRGTGIIGGSTRRKMRSRLRPKELRRNRGYALQEMDVMERYSPKSFTRMFRLSPVEFHALLDKIKPDSERLGRSNIPKMVGLDDVIEPKTKLACALRWLAGVQFGIFVLLSVLLSVRFIKNMVSCGAHWRP